MSDQKKDWTRAVLNQKSEAEEGRRRRIDSNRDNFDCYHLRQDWSHKKEGQSQEFLAKQQIATEQLSSFLTQGLVDSGEWFSVENHAGKDDSTMKVTANLKKKLLMNHLERTNYDQKMYDAIKTCLLGSLMIIKVGGKKVERKEFEAEENEEGRKELKKLSRNVWQLDWQLIRPENYYPDPTGDGQYEIEQCELDLYELKRRARANPDVYNVENVNSLGMNAKLEDEREYSRETNQTQTTSKRVRVKIFEIWGNIIDHTTGELLHENIHAAITDDGMEIIPPRKNPFWHRESPYVVSPLVRVPNSVWHRALMDAPTYHNRALNEVYNLQLDSALMATFGIKQYREHWMEDPTQIDDGIAPGDSIGVNTECPPNGKAIERVDTTNPTSEGQAIFQQTEREFQASSMTNDTRLGALPQRAVKATEIVASNQSITSVMNGIVKIIENNWARDLLDKSWMNIAQNVDDLNTPEMMALFKNDKAFNVFKSMSPEEIFADTVGKHNYKVFGLSNTLNKIQDFRKITALLQTLGTNELMLSLFMKKFSMPKLLGEIVKSLDINEDKITADQEEQQFAGGLQDAALKRVQAQGQTGEEATDEQSQIPQAGATREEFPSGIEIPRGQASQVQGF